MQVLLEIPNQNAWQALQPLIQYLQIEVVEPKTNVAKKLPFLKKRSKKEQSALDSLLKKGVEIQNFENLMAEFEESLQDRILPFRD